MLKKLCSFNTLQLGREDHSVTIKHSECQRNSGRDKFSLLYGTCCLYKMIIMLLGRPYIHVKERALHQSGYLKYENFTSVISLVTYQ